MKSNTLKALKGETVLEIVAVSTSVAKMCVIQ